MVFPDIFCIVQHQQKTVAEVWTPQDWGTVFRRMLNDWELTRVLNFTSSWKNLKDYRMKMTILVARSQKWRLYSECSIQNDGSI